MKFFSITIILSLILNLAYAQQTDDCEQACGAHIRLNAFERLNAPWYGNNQFLYDYLDSLDMRELNNNKVLYRIPVKFWVYYSQQPDDGISPKELRQIMQDLNNNNQRNNTGFRFYLKDITYIKKPKFTNLGYYMEASRALMKNKDKDCINVYVVRNIIKKRPFRRNVAIRGTYRKISKVIFLRRVSSSTTLTHEIGHYFGLLHPHEDCSRSKRYQECVSRTRKFPWHYLRRGLICENNGDGLADTPAEPLLSGMVNKDCEYIGNRKDSWGDNYEPLTDNIMSYPANLNCRTNFTEGQRALMLYTAKKRAKAGWVVKNEERQYNADRFEPNNTQKMASHIEIDKKQHHTFHKVYMGKGKKNRDDDVDWLRFKVERQYQQLTITTSLGLYANPDTEIELFDGAFRSLAKDDNSNDSLCSKIVFPNPKTGTYFLKISKKKAINGKEIGDYKIEINSK